MNNSEKQSVVKEIIQIVDLSPNFIYDKETRKYIREYLEILIETIKGRYGIKN